MCSDHKELDGQCLQLPGDSKVYLVDIGKTRWIPNPGTFNNLFRSWRIVPATNEKDICQGTDITNGAILAQGQGDAAVWLIDNGLKRHVASPATMDKYNFSWSAISHVPLILLNYIPTGPEIT